MQAPIEAILAAIMDCVLKPLNHITLEVFWQSWRKTSP